MTGPAAEPTTTTPNNGLWARKGRDVAIASTLCLFVISVAFTNWPLVAGQMLGHELFVRYWPRIQGGLLTTLNLVFVSMLIGGTLAFPIAFARDSRNRFLSGWAFSYVYFFRGTPLLAQTFLIYHGLGQFMAPHRELLDSLGLWAYAREAYWYVLFAFALNTAAYQAEILRGAIASIPKGQREACQSLGIPDHIGFRKVILPQALITALRPYGNEIILMIKGSAVATVVTVFDLMGTTRLAFSRSFNFEVYLWAAILYLLLVECLRRIWDIVEWWITRHLRPANG